MGWLFSTVVVGDTDIADGTDIVAPSGAVQPSFWYSIGGDDS